MGKCFKDENGNTKASKDNKVDLLNDIFEDIWKNQASKVNATLHQNSKIFKKRIQHNSYEINSHDNSSKLPGCNNKAITIDIILKRV